MGGASWYSDGMEASFGNISIIKLPHYSPVLNPIEQVWSWMRLHHLANRSFKGYKNIVDEVCHAWDRFVSDSKRAIETCARDWMNLIS